MKWEDISIRQYGEMMQQMRYMTDDGKDDEIESWLNLLSISSSRPIDEIEEQPLWKTQEQMDELRKMLNSKVPTTKPRTEYSVNGVDLVLLLDPNQMTTQQFVDYQMYMKLADSNDMKIAYVLSCFLTPVGKSYGKGYCVQNLIKDIYKEFSIVDASAISGFFFQQFKALSAISLSSTMKRLKKKMRKAQGKEKIRIGRMLAMTKGYMDGLTSFHL